MLTVLLATSVNAQVFQRSWVNPQSGSDITGTVNDPTKPYLTLQEAINDTTAPGIVYALPGLYSENPNSANGESFPVVMKDRVHLQGAGAKECVVRRTDYEDTVWSFMPYDNPAGMDDGDVVRIAPVISMQFVGNTVPTSIEGFTFQGGDVQVWTWPEASQAGRVSNCIFDMRHDVPEASQGPEFGILMISIWDWQGELYHPLDYHIFSNTFIQAYNRPNVVQPDLARPSSVAICNVNDPVTSQWWEDMFEPDPIPDPNPSLRGVSALNIQNNLVRHLPNRPGVAFLGIDHPDTSVAQGTVLGPSNAFDPTDSGGSDDTGTWISAILLGGPPQAKVAINQDGVGPYQDPGFIGEMIGLTQSGSLANPALRDWRLLPDSLLLDQGSAPVQVPPLGSTIRANSGLSFVDSLPTPIKAFDWDGDGHGNARRVGAQPDIGMDEVGYCTIAGNYGNDSKSHNVPFDAQRITAGNAQRSYITALGGAVLQSYFTTQPYVTGVGWSISPGTVQTGVPFSSFGLMYLDQSIMQVINLGSTLATPWINPVDSVTHSMGLLILTANEAPPPIHLNQQLLVGTTPSGTKLSELHFEIY